MSAVNELVITPEFVTNIIAVDLADETTFTTADKAKLNGIEAGAQVNTVTRVAGKTGVVELDAGDIAYDASETYASGKIGAALKSAEEKLNTINAGDIGYDGSTAYDTGTVGEELTHLNRQISEDITPAIEEIETALDSKAPAIYETVSGEIASFADGADGMPVKSLVANIEPVQDLHGYANPWPAGGGKNKANVPDVAQTTRDGLTYRIQNGILYINGTYTGSGLPLFTQNVSFEENQYTFSVQLLGGAMSGTNASFNGYTSTNERKWLAPFGNSGASVGTTATGDITQYGVSINTGITFTNAVIGFQIEANSAVTSFSPYSNICPISGHTGASVTRTGKNLVNVNSSEITGAYIDAAGEIHASTTWSVSDFVPVMVGKNYILSGLTSYPNTGVDNFIFYDSGKNKVSKTSQNALTSFAIPSGVAYVKFSWKNTEKDTVMFEQSSTASAYEPFGTTISVTFPSEAGTVYGGTLTLNPDRTGTLVVDRAITQIINLVFAGSNGRFYSTTINNVIKHQIGQYDFVKSDRYKTVNVGSLGSLNNGEISVDRLGNIQVCDERYTAPNDFRSTEGDGQVVYELANPITYQLTETEISGILSTLYGTNNVWADTGDVSIDYPADTKLYIDGKIAEAIAAALNA